MTPGLSASPDLGDALKGLDDALCAIERDLNLLDEIAENTPVPMIVGNGRHWRIVSRSLANLLGYTREFMEARTYEAFMHPDDAPGVAEAAEVVLKTGQPGDARTRYRKADGGWRVLDWRWGPPGPSGYTFAFATDRGDYVGFG